MRREVRRPKESRNASCGIGFRHAQDPQWKAVTGHRSPTSVTRRTPSRMGSSTPLEPARATPETLTTLVLRVVLRANVAPSAERQTEHKAMKDFLPTCCKRTANARPPIDLQTVASCEPWARKSSPRVDLTPIAIVKMLRRSCLVERLEIWVRTKLQPRPVFTQHDKDAQYFTIRAPRSGWPKVVRLRGSWSGWLLRMQSSTPHSSSAVGRNERPRAHRHSRERSCFLARHGPQAASSASSAGTREAGYPSSDCTVEHILAIAARPCCQAELWHWSPPSCVFAPRRISRSSRGAVDGTAADP